MCESCKEKEEEEEKGTDNLLTGEACCRVIVNMNSGSTMQLSPNYWLCPEG